MNNNQFKAQGRHNNTTAGRSGRKMAHAKTTRYYGLSIAVLSLFVGVILGTFSSFFQNSPACTNTNNLQQRPKSTGIKHDESIGAAATNSSIAVNMVSGGTTPAWDPPNGTATTAENKCTCPDRLYTKSSWNEEEWSVDDIRQCHLEPLSASGFCRVLGNRSILVAGDSISGQLHAQLLQLLRGKFPSATTVHLNQRFKNTTRAVHFSGTICQGTKLTFIRNDYLRMDQTLEDRVEAQAFLIPWLHLIPSYEVLILNTGVHVPPGKIDFYKENLKQLRVYLEETIQYKGRVIFRTTPRGHSNCSTYEKPITSTNSSEWKRFFQTNSPNSQARRYEWNLMPSFNQVMRQEMESFATVLDVAQLTELRPDYHAKPPIDCLHYNSKSNVYDVWSRLIYNALLGSIC